MKRQKTGVKTVNPIGTISQKNGVSALQWSTNDSIVCGGVDHQLKVIDVTKQAVQESIFLNHKTVQCLDSTSSLVLTGMEDGVVRCYDLRVSASSTKSQAVMTFDCHTRMVS